MFHWIHVLRFIYTSDFTVRFPCAFYIHCLTKIDDSQDLDCNLFQRAREERKNARPKRTTKMHFQNALPKCMAKMHGQNAWPKCMAKMHGQNVSPKCMAKTHSQNARPKRTCKWGLIVELAMFKKHHPDDNRCWFIFYGHRLGLFHCGIFFQRERYSLARAVGAVFEKKNTKQFLW